MAFDWKATVRAIAPTIGTALGGPFAGMATKFVADKFLGNPDATEADIALAITTASPEKLLDLKKLDQDFKIQLRELDIKTYQLEIQDRTSARVDLRDDRRTQAILSAVFIAGYFGFIFFLFTGDSVQDLTGEVLGIASTLIGVVTAAIPMILQFWFGSSMGSKNKDATISDMGKQ